MACILSIMLSNVDSPTGHMEKFLRALHTIFHQCASKKDFCNLTKSKIFALPFCGHRWVENQMCVTLLRMY